MLVAKRGCAQPNTRLISEGSSDSEKRCLVGDGLSAWLIKVGLSG